MVGNVHISSGDESEPHFSLGTTSSYEETLARQRQRRGGDLTFLAITHQTAEQVVVSYKRQTHHDLQGERSTIPVAQAIKVLFTTTNASKRCPIGFAPRAFVERPMLIILGLVPLLHDFLESGGSLL